jgi:hypothetical protein
MFGRTPSLRPALKPSGDLLDEAPRWFRGVCHFDWSEDDRQRESCEHDGQVGVDRLVFPGLDRAAWRSLWDIWAECSTLTRLKIKLTT